MRALRTNCIVLDTSILPKRPCISDIKKFMDNKLQLDMSLVKSIQPHNVKNVVYLGMHSDEAAERIASQHHLKHFMEYEGKKIPIPIYVESSAIDVRLHDLPDDMDNVVIIDHMRQYGEVMAIRSEVWKNYFPGYSNGSRVVKIKLTRPVPSFITVDDEITMVTYHNQVRTCRNCGRKSHPKQRCSDVVTAQANNDNSPATDQQHQNTNHEIPRSNSSNFKTNTINKTKESNVQQSTAANSKQWPALPKPTPRAEQQRNNKIETKRQRSIDSDTTNNETKRLNADNSDANESDSSLISVSGDICPYTQRPYRIPDYSHIEDAEERCALIEEDKRRIDAAYLEQLKKKKNSVP